jgi:shikimate kinase
VIFFCLLSFKEQTPIFIVMSDRLYLIGFMGSGKSSQGKILAGKLGWRFVDMDERIEELSGLSIPQIFKKHGENYFRLKESEVLQTLSEREHVVISTGGGVPCHHDNMDLMNETGLTIYLKLPPAALLGRLVSSRTERPLLKSKSEEELEQYIIEKLKEREPFYNQAKIVVDGHSDVVNRILRVLKTN